MAENVDNIEYPPFCELCLVKFTNNKNASIHFDGVNHFNRIMMVQRRESKPYWCEICCCELNTERMLEIHKNSPKHRKKEEALVAISQLKEQYLEFKQANKDDSYWEKMEQENQAESQTNIETTTDS